jgi:polysaccharide chain length determinant protein (PEP-CTERM system associated)
MEDTRHGSLLESASAVWRRRTWIAVVAFLVPCVAVVCLLTALPDVYQATATVLIERQQVPEAFVKPVVASEVEMRLHALSQDVLSRARLQTLVERFDLYPDRSGQPATADRVTRLRRDIDLELKAIERKSHNDFMTTAFTVSYRGGDPVMAAEIANVVASFFVEQNVRSRAQQATGTSAFLKVQLDETKARLDTLERRVGEFKTRHLGELPEQLPANLATLEQLHAQLRVNSVNQSRLVERRALRGETAGEVDPVTGTVQESPRARLARMRAELGQLRTQYSEHYPDVRRLRAEIAGLEEQAAREPAEPPAGTDRATARRRLAVGEVDAELVALKAEEKRVRDAIAVYQRRVENTPHREQSFRELARDYDATREHYGSLLKRYEEAQIAQSLEAGRQGDRFRIVEAAMPPAEAVAPNRLRLMLLGLLLALGVAAAATVLAEQLDTSFHSVDDVRAFTTVPVTAGIPLIVTESDRTWAARRRRLGMAALAGGLLAVGALSWLVGDGNVSLVSLLARGKV